MDDDLRRRAKKCCVSLTATEIEVVSYGDDLGLASEVCLAIANRLAELQRLDARLVVRLSQYKKDRVDGLYLVWEEDRAESDVLAEVERQEARIASQEHAQYLELKRKYEG